MTIMPTTTVSLDMQSRLTTKLTIRHIEYTRTQFHELVRTVVRHEMRRRVTAVRHWRRRRQFVRLQFANDARTVGPDRTQRQLIIVGAQLFRFQSTRPISVPLNRIEWSPPYPLTERSPKLRPPVGVDCSAPRWRNWRRWQRRRNASRSKSARPSVAAIAKRCPNLSLMRGTKPS